MRQWRLYLPSHICSQMAGPSMIPSQCTPHLPGSVQLLGLPTLTVLRVSMRAPTGRRSVGMLTRRAEMAVRSASGTGSTCISASPTFPAGLGRCPACHIWHPLCINLYPRTYLQAASTSAKYLSYARLLELLCCHASIMSATLSKRYLQTLIM